MNELTNYLIIISGIIIYRRGTKWKNDESIKENKILQAVKAIYSTFHISTLYPTGTNPWRLITVHQDPK